MKLLMATFLIPFTTWAAEPLVTCQVADFKSCKDCAKRIPVSCEDNGFTGSMNTSLKPQKIQWLVSNAKNGTERLIWMDNKTLSLNDLKNAKDMKALAAKQKVAASSDESVSMAGIQVASGTELFKAQTGKEIAAKLKAQNPARAIASEVQPPRAGGVGRALKMKDQKQ